MQAELTCVPMEILSVMGTPPLSRSASMQSAWPLAMIVQCVGTISISSCLCAVYLLVQNTGSFAVSMTGSQDAVHGGVPLLHIKRIVGPYPVIITNAVYIPSGVCCAVIAPSVDRSPESSLARWTWEGGAWRVACAAAAI